MNEENLQQAPARTESSDGPTAVDRKEEQKSSTGAKIGYFFLSFVPAFLCFVLQIAALLVILIPRMVIGMINKTFDTSSAEAYQNSYLELVTGSVTWGIFLYHIIGVVVFGLWYYLSFRKPRPTLKASVRKTTLSAVLVSVICGIALCFFSNGTVVVESHLFPSMVEGYMKLMEQAGFGVDTLSIIASVILAPIGEEFLCRGITLKYAKKCFGKFWMANILQAFLFGAIHGNFVQGLYAFFIGLVLGYLAERYQTLIPCIILHFVVNFSSTTWVSMLFDAMFGDVIPGLLVGLLMLIIPSAIVAALLWKTKKNDVK